jgi:hypothetical protein
MVTTEVTTLPYTSMGKYGTNGIAVIIALNPSGPWTDRQDLDAVGGGGSFFLFFDPTSSS